MAVAVASSQTNTASSSTSLVITKPTGLAVGDGLVAVIYTHNTVGGSTDINTPSGWEKMQDQQNAMQADTQRVITFNKVATSGDVAASNFTFDSSNSIDWNGILMRTTGSRDDDIYDVGDAGAVSNSADPSFTLSITPPQNTVLLVASVAGGQNTTWREADSPVINGTNPTWTQQYDSGSVEVFTAPVETTAAITSLDFTITGGNASDDWVASLSVINGQIDASSTLSLTSSSQTAFTPTVGAGVQTTLSLTENSNTQFEPTAQVSHPTQWTNEDKQADATVVNIDKP